MDFNLTQSQQLLVGSARDFFQEHCPANLVQDMALDPRGFPEELWERVSSLGWPGLLIPESLGGSVGTLLDVILLIEEMGRACYPSPYIQSSVVATSLILALGSQRLKEALLPDMARGRRLCVLALTEESADFTPEAIALQGEVGGTLNGHKLFVKDAHIADDLIVVATGGGGANLLLIKRDQPDVDSKGAASPRRPADL